MPVSRERKEQLVADLAKELGGAQALILTDYRGVPTGELNGLRGQLRKMQSGFHVAKNTLIILALKRAGLPIPEDMLEGPTAIAFCYTDIAGPAKAVTDFMKEKEISVKGAILGGRILRGPEVNSLAALPSRERLLGQLLGTINAPSAQAAGVVAAGIRQVLYALRARVEQLEKQGAQVAG